MSTVAHGALDYGELARLGLAPDDVLDFSSNINPFGPPEALVKALRNRLSASLLARYPDRECLAVRERLAALHGLSPAQILVGNGSADLIALLMQTVARGKRVAVLAPTFGEYAHAAALAGATVHLVPRPGWQHHPDGTFARAPSDTIADCAARLAALAPDIVVLCNPNNPTGDLLTPDALARLRHAAPSALWVFDAAYEPFCDALAQPATPDAHTIVLHSLTKDFALAGIRLGYLLAPPDIVARLYAAQPPWNVNALAQQSALLALEMLDWRTQTIAALLVERRRVEKGLRVQGWMPYPTTTNFLLLPVGNGTHMRRRLLTHGILVRDATSFGLPHCIRIAVRRPAENDRLLACLGSPASQNA
nr:histidinol-phosphate transaminase [Ardenticatena sp.]